MKNYTSAIGEDGWPLHSGPAVEVGKLLLQAIKLCHPVPDLRELGMLLDAVHTLTMGNIWKGIHPPFSFEAADREELYRLQAFYKNTLNAHKARLRRDRASYLRKNPKATSLDLLHFDVELAVPDVGASKVGIVRSALALRWQTASNPKQSASDRKESARRLAGWWLASGFATAQAANREVAVAAAIGSMDNARWLRELRGKPSSRDCVKQVLSHAFAIDGEAIRKMIDAAKTPKKASRR